MEYVESRLNKVSSNDLSESEMLSLLGGDGGFQIDAVLFMIQQSKLRLHHDCNIHPDSSSRSKSCRYRIPQKT